LAKVVGEEARFLALRHVCLSSDVAEPLEALDAAQVTIAETPDESALFRALSRSLREFPSLGASRI
jgi:uroporphyrinogen-III synthase